MGCSKAWPSDRPYIFGMLVSEGPLEISAPSPARSSVYGRVTDGGPYRRILSIQLLLGATARFVLSALPGLVLGPLCLTGFAQRGTMTRFPVAITCLFPGQAEPYSNRTILRPKACRTDLDCSWWAELRCQ